MPHIAAGGHGTHTSYLSVALYVISLTVGVGYILMKLLSVIDRFLITILLEYDAALMSAYEEDSSRSKLGIRVT